MDTVLWLVRSVLVLCFELRCEIKYEVDFGVQGGTERGGGSLKEPCICSTRDWGSYLPPSK
jgi:hypothetical protein